jgi:hypothetical protein
LVARTVVTTRLARVLRWQWRPKNERQVWLGAAVYGLFLSGVFAAGSWYFHGQPALGLAYGAGVALIYGLDRRHRLRNRQSAEVAADPSERMVNGSAD